MLLENRIAVIYGADDRDRGQHQLRRDGRLGRRRHSPPCLALGKVAQDAEE